MLRTKFECLVNRLNSVRARETLPKGQSAGYYSPRDRSRFCPMSVVIVRREVQRDRPTDGRKSRVRRAQNSRGGCRCCRSGERIYCRLWRPRSPCLAGAWAGPKRLRISSSGTQCRANSAASSNASSRISMPRRSHYRIVPVFKGSYTETVTAAIFAMRTRTHPAIVQVNEIANRDDDGGERGDLSRVRVDAGRWRGLRHRPVPARDCRLSIPI